METEKYLDAFCNSLHQKFSQNFTQEKGSYKTIRQFLGLFGLILV